MKKGDKVLFVFAHMGSVVKGEFVKEINGTTIVDICTVSSTLDKFSVISRLVFPDTPEGRKSLCNELEQRIQYAVSDLKKYGGSDETR